MHSFEICSVFFLFFFLLFGTLVYNMLQTRFKRFLKHLTSTFRTKLTCSVVRNIDIFKTFPTDCLQIFIGVELMLKMKYKKNRGAARCRFRIVKYLGQGIVLVIPPPVNGGQIASIAAIAEDAERSCDPGYLLSSLDPSFLDPSKLKTSH